MKIKEYASTLDSQGISTKRKVIRLAKEDKLEKALHAWFIHSCQQTISSWKLASTSLRNKKN